jgi:hypothetical protein
MLTTYLCFEKYYPRDLNARILLNYPYNLLYLNKELKFTVYNMRFQHDPLDSSEIDNSTRIYLFGKVREILRLSPPERVKHIGPCQNKKYST